MKKEGFSKIKNMLVKNRNLSKFRQKDDSSNKPKEVMSKESENNQNKY